MTKAREMVKRLSVLANAEGGGAVADALYEAADIIEELLAKASPLEAMEVTEEMIEAGAHIIRMSTPAIQRNSTRTLAEAIFRAMRDAGGGGDG